MPATPNAAQHAALHPIVQAALNAMAANDRAAWLALFTHDIVLFDDGEAHDFLAWSDGEIFSPQGSGSRACITAITKVTDDGLSFEGQLHSAQWGDFAVYNRFHLREGKIARLEVGQLK